jgi:hypothetical protein
VGVPSAIGDLASETAPVVVGWCTPTGPVALPGTWDPDSRLAVVEAALFAAVGGYAAAPACVLFDATEGTSLEAKAGMVLRGHGAARRRISGGKVHLAIDTDRISWWRGDRSSTVKAG